MKPIPKEIIAEDTVLVSMKAYTIHIQAIFIRVKKDSHIYFYAVASHFNWSKSGSNIPL
jgi:hypothetical protein